MARAEQLGENLSVLRQGARCAGAQGRGSLGGEAAGGRSPADQQLGRLVDDPQTGH